MNFNLTDNQKELARWIHEMIKKGELPETFRIAARGRGKVWIDTLGDMKGRDGPMNWDQADSGAFHALCADGLLIVNPEEESAIEMAGRRIVTRRAQDALTVTGKFYQAVNSNFIEEVVSPPISTLAQPHPPEIALSIDRLRTKFPDPKKLGFLVMRFAAAKPFQRIVEIIK